jgi:hypothetical protein
MAVGRLGNPTIPFRKPGAETVVQIHGFTSETQRLRLRSRATARVESRGGEYLRPVAIGPSDQKVRFHLIDPR